MILTGISDEAGKDIHSQIKAHKQLGWQYLELRLVDGKNVAGELPDEEFSRLADILEKENMKVTGFASRIANWSRYIKEDFTQDVEDLKKSIPRMHRLGVKYIRIMSWKGDGVNETYWQEEAIRRCKELTKIAEDGGIFLCHENCTGWGGLNAKNMLKMRDSINSKNFLLLYDIGNVVAHGSNVDDFFTTIRNQFSYIHVKDVKKGPDGEHSDNFTFCGEGDAKIKEILNKVINQDKYDGIISIEPHVANIFHKKDGSTASPEKLFSSYIKYGELLKNIVNEIKIV